MRADVELKPLVSLQRSLSSSARLDPTIAERISILGSQRETRARRETANQRMKTENSRLKFFEHAPLFDFKKAPLDLSHFVRGDGFIGLLLAQIPPIFT